MCVCVCVCYVYVMCVSAVFCLMCMCELFWLLPAVDASPQEEKDLFPCQTKSLKGQAKTSDSEHHLARHTHTQMHSV